MKSRSSWGARRPKSIRRRMMSSRSSRHWNGPQVRVAGKTTWDHDKCPALIRGIQNFHMDSRGWNDIAYNFIVCPHDEVYEGRGFDVTNGANGTNSGNMSSHAIMWLSGQGNSFTDGEKSGFRKAVQLVSERTTAPAKAMSHRDHKPTECPGDERYNWIKSGMPISGSTPQKPSQPKPEPKDEFTMDAEAKQAFKSLNERIDTLENQNKAMAFVIGIDFNDKSPNDTADRATLGQALAWAKAGAIKAFDGDAAAARKEAVKYDPGNPAYVKSVKK